MSKKIVFWILVLLLAACDQQAPASPQEEAFPAPEVLSTAMPTPPATPSYTLCKLPTLPMGMLWDRWDGQVLEGGLRFDGEEVSFTLEVRGSQIILNGITDDLPLEEKEIRVIPVVLAKHPDGRFEIFGPSLYKCHDGTLFIAYQYMFGGFFIEPSEGGEQA